MLIYLISLKGKQIQTSLIGVIQLELYFFLNEHFKITSFEIKFS